VDGLAVRAQYGPGVIGGEPVPGYLEEPGVRPGSTTETFAALRLGIRSWRWAGVPFYLRTGKRLARRITEIAVTLKPVPYLPFADQGYSLGVKANQLVLTLQPDEGVSVSIVGKIPGPRMVLRPVKMEFLYGASFLSQSPEA
jgi:glucose-6-phosphate 1-dehydrogenase